MKRHVAAATSAPLVSKAVMRVAAAPLQRLPFGIHSLWLPTWLVILVLIAVQASTAPASTPPAALRAALARVSPAIVRINTIGGAAPLRSGGQDEERRAADTRVADGPTTGVIWSSDGLIVTSSINFVREPSIITVALHDGSQRVARLVARDQTTRLALLSINASDLPTLERAALASVQVGQQALAAGFGHGASAPTLSVGVVSALGRVSGMAIQTDARTSPANYGGPLFDLRGRLLGICAPIAPGDDDELAGLEWHDSGIGFAIHAELVAQRIERLKAGRDLERGLLGLSLDHGFLVRGMEPASAPAVSGLRVLDEPVGPAQAAGLKVDDVITHVQTQPVTRLFEFRRAMAPFVAGDSVELRWMRGEQELNGTVTLAPRATFAQPASGPAP